MTEDRPTSCTKDNARRAEVPIVPSIEALASRNAIEKRDGAEHLAGTDEANHPLGAPDRPLWAIDTSKRTFSPA
jgi:hypothetical protein